MRFKIHAKAVIVGVATGVVVGLALGFLLGLVQPQIRVGGPLGGNPLHIVSLTIGFFATLLAAYLTARLSPTDKVANVMIFWAISELLGVLSLVVSTFPLWYNIAGTFVVCIGSILGWYIEQKKR